MASTSGSKKDKIFEKQYVVDSESDDDDIDLSFLDFSKETFIPPPDLCQDPFLNLLCDEQMLRRSFDEKSGDNNQAEVNEPEHPHMNAPNAGQVGVEFRVHDPTIDWKEMEPHLGECYESPAQLRFALVNYAVGNGFQLYFEKSDRRRVVAKCGSKQADHEELQCPFRLAAGWKYNERTFQIKALDDIHLCSRNYKFGSLVTCSWIAKHYLQDIILKPKMTLMEMKEDVLQKFSVHVSKGQCQRARTEAMEMIEGKLEEHYSRIWDYAEELRRSNPGTSCFVGLEDGPPGVKFFKRFYVCFKALKDGWTMGCRRVIGLDGCFLKGQIKGEILSAIGRDADNHVYPIAWAVVTVENKDNWSWFIENLVNDLDLGGGNGLVIISDQHKGLLPAVAEWLPHAEHRACARHVLSNFRKRFTGIELKNIFWAAATSTVEGDFIANMEKIKNITETGYNYLMSTKPETWCRAFFGHGYCCEAVENGISESFNGLIVHMRKKPLLTMLEEIRIYVMRRHYHQAHEVIKWRGNFGPNVLGKMGEFGKKMRLWTVVPSGGDIFEARYGYSGYKVDLAGRTCSCNLWMLSGIPCVHAQAAINFIHKDPINYIAAWYHKDYFIAVYRDNILPVGGSNMWPRTTFTKPLPPLVRRMPGRPKVKRRKCVIESQDNKRLPGQRIKVPRTVRCSNCQVVGHNKHTCPNEPVPRFQEPKRKTGRPRKDGTSVPAYDQFPPRPTPRPRAENSSQPVNRPIPNAENSSQPVNRPIPNADSPSQPVNTPRPRAENGSQPVNTGGPSNGVNDDEATRVHRGKGVMQGNVVSPKKKKKMMANRGGKKRSLKKTIEDVGRGVGEGDGADDFFDEMFRETGELFTGSGYVNEQDETVNERDYVTMEDVEYFNQQVKNQVEPVIDPVEEHAVLEDAVEEHVVEEPPLDPEYYKKVAQDLLESGYSQNAVDEAVGEIKQVDAEAQMEEVVINEEVMDGAAVKDRVVVPGRRRGKSQRIARMKLRKVGPDPDGGGSSKEQAWSLD